MISRSQFKDFYRQELVLMTEEQIEVKYLLMAQKAASNLLRKQIGESKMNIFRVENGNTSAITIDEAIETQRREDYGMEVITAYCDTEEQADILATKFDKKLIDFGNISGDLAIRHGLIGLSWQGE